MKALVTGGAGFIGSHISDMLLGEGHEVAVVDNLSTGKKENLPAAAAFHQIDITDDAMKEVFESERPGIVFHTAAQISVSRSVRFPMEDANINTLGSLRLLDLCVRYGAKKVVFSSSGGTVYGEVPGDPAGEDYGFNPVSPYGISKMSFEYYLNFYRSEYGLDFTSLRYGNVYGPRQDPHGEAGVVAIFTRLMLDGKTPTINGDGKYVRDYVFVEDVARANLACIDAGHGEALNVGTGIPTDVNDIFAVLAGTIGFDTPAEYGPPRPGDLRRSLLDISRIKNAIGWQPRISLEEGMKATVDFFRNRQNSR